MKKPQESQVIEQYLGGHPKESSDLANSGKRRYFHLIDEGETFPKNTLTGELASQRIAESPLSVHGSQASYQITPGSRHNEARR